MSMRHIVISDLPSYTTFLRLILKRRDLNSSFKHATWSKDSILCFDAAILFVTTIGPAFAKATWRDCLLHFIDCVAARTCCAVHVLTSRISFLFSWLWWMGSVVKHIMLKKFLNLKGLFWFPLRNLSEIFLILTRTERDVIKNVKLSSCTVPIFLSYFTGTRIFSTDFHKTLKYKISWQSFWWQPSYCMWTDGQTWS